MTTLDWIVLVIFLGGLFGIILWVLKHENQHESEWKKYVYIAQKSENSGNNPLNAKANKILLGANSIVNLFTIIE